MAEQGPDFYDARVANYAIDLWRSKYLAVYAHAASLLSGAPVVDLGCGTGRLAKLLEFRGQADYWGIDFSEVRINQARQYVRNEGFIFEVADLYDPEIQSRFESFSDFVALEVLEHLERDRDLVASIPSGTRLVASVPNYPAEAHVRHFKTFRKAAARYRRWLRIDEHSVAVIPRPKKGSRIWVFSGYQAVTCLATKG